MDADAGWPCLCAVICQPVIHTRWRKEEEVRRNERRKKPAVEKARGEGGNDGERYIRGRNEKARRRRVWRRACGPTSPSAALPLHSCSSSSSTFHYLPSGEDTYCCQSVHSQRERGLMNERNWNRFCLRGLFLNFVFRMQFFVYFFSFFFFFFTICFWRPLTI